MLLMTPGDSWWHGGCKTAGSRIKREITAQKDVVPLYFRDNGWNPAIFLVLFRASEGNKSIYTDNPAGCELIWVARYHPNIFMPDALPATTLPIYPGLGQALS